MPIFNIDKKCFLSSKSVYDNDFWRSRDTEDWSNDAENTALHHRNKLHFNIYSNRKQFFTILLFYCIFDQINGECKRFKNIKKSYRPKLLNNSV